MREFRIVINLPQVYTAPMTNPFDDAVTAFRTHLDNGWNNWVNESRSKMNLPTKEENTYLDGGVKFLRISRNNSVTCFVATSDGETKGLGKWKEGDIFMAAGYKAPAKNVRGNIYDFDSYSRAASRGQINYLK